jgi:hypothetical protein
MISYEELCAALERHAARHAGEAPVHTAETNLPPVHAEPPTGEHVMPHGDDEHTNAGVQPIFDDRSNELDIGDVLSDEEVQKH